MNLNKNASNDSRFKLIGYHKGLKQVSFELKVNFQIAKEFDFARVAKILTGCFDLETPPISSRLPRQLTSDELHAQNYFWLVMLLACNLLQSLKIPSVATGLITAINSIDIEKSTFQATCQVPTVEHTPVSFITQSLGEAHRFIGSISKIGLTDLELSSLLDQLDERLIAPLGRMVPGGKSTIAVLKTAYQIGIPFMHIGSGIYQLGWGAHSHFFDRSMMGLDSAIGASIVHNKIQAAKVLKQAGLPAPVHKLVKTMDDARSAVVAIGFPVVVKPSDMDRGEGVTVGVDSLKQLELAFEHASKASQNILIERQIPGVCHRILVVDGHHVYTVARQPKSVEGDGVHNIKELCDMETQKESLRAKHLRLSPYVFDELTEHTLSKQGMSYDSIPNQGALVYMRPIETTAWGGTPKLVTEDIHPENIRIALQAAQIMGLKVAGVDLISDDIKKPWYENGAVINEINCSPLFGLRLDYQRDAAKKSLQILFNENGRIPIEVYIGDNTALEAAFERQKELMLKGAKCYVTTHLESYNENKELVVMASTNGLYNRCKSLLMNRDCQTLVLVVQTDELLFTGLPVDSVNVVNVVNDKILNNFPENKLASNKIVDAILELFKTYAVSQIEMQVSPNSAMTRR